MSTFIILQAKGEMKLGTLVEGTPIEASIGKVLKRAKAPQLIGSWNWLKYKLFLYGYKEGRAGSENKHEIPPPFNEMLLFGDCCVVASLEKTSDKPASFSIDLYKKFYNTQFGSFDDLEDDEEDDEDEDEPGDEYDEDDLGEEDEEDLVEIQQEEEEEEVKPTLCLKSSVGFKKIAKWMFSPELKPEPYLI